MVEAAKNTCLQLNLCGSCEKEWQRRVVVVVVAVVGMRSRG